MDRDRTPWSEMMAKGVVSVDVELELECTVSTR